MRDLRPRLAIGVLVLGILVWLIFASITGWSSARFSAQLDELHSARDALATLVARASHLAKKSDQSPQVPADWLWPGPDQASDMQRKVVDLANATGIVLSSYGGSAGPSDLNLPTVAFEIEAQSDYPSLARFLAGLEALEPRVSTGSMWINRAQPNPSAPTDARLSLRLMVWGFVDAGKAAP